MISTIKTFSHFFLETREDSPCFFLHRLKCSATPVDPAQDIYLRIHICEQRVPTKNRRVLSFANVGKLVVDHVNNEGFCYPWIGERLGALLKVFPFHFAQIGPWLVTLHS